MKKTQQILDLEKNLEQALRHKYPDVKVNIYRLQEGILSADVVSKKFTGSWLPHFETIRKVPDVQGLLDGYLYALCPVTPDAFENRVIGEDEYR